MTRIAAWAAAAGALWRRRSAAWGDRLAARRAATLARARPLRAGPEPASVGDAEAAARFAAGEIGGAVLDLRGGSPFATPAPAPAAEALHGFAWLDDAAVAARPDRERLRGWAFDWLRRFGGGAGPGWRPAVAGRRAARLAAHAGWLSDGADRRDAARLRRAVAAHVAFLARRWRAAEAPLDRLEAAAGLTLAALALPGADRALDRGATALGETAAALIGVDGGIAARDADALARAFGLLAWTHHALVAAGCAPDARHGVAVHRAALALRALRLGDGGLPRFHGAGGAPADALDEAFALAGPVARGPRRDHAMGFQRLAAGRTVAILDAGPPPLAGPAGGASALGLEVTVGGRRLFGSVGSGARCGGEWALAARATAAHSTVEVAGVSCARLAPDDWAARALGRGFAAAPTVTRETARDIDGLWVRAEHDGYLARFGLMTARRLHLSIDGRTLSGEDALHCPDADARRRFDAAAEDGGVPFFVRFHLAPAVDAALDPGGRAARLTAPDGAAFALAAARGALTIEPGVWIDGDGAPRPARQVVIAARAEAYWGRVSWTLAALAAPARPRAETARA